MALKYNFNEGCFTVVFHAIEDWQYDSRICSFNVALKIITFCLFNDQYVNCTAALIDIVTLKQFEIIQAISFLFFSSFLAGEGAYLWALDHGFIACRDEDMITGECDWWCLI